jgi:hypothetical protein
VVGIETSYKILVGLTGPARMFHGQKAGNETKHLRRTTLWLEQDFLIGNKLLG